MRPDMAKALPNKAAIIEKYKTGVCQDCDACACKVTDDEVWKCYEKQDFVTGREQVLEERVGEIKGRLDYYERMGYVAIMPRQDVQDLIAIIEGLEKQKALLEAKIFSGIDPRGRTNIKKLRDDLDAAMLADDSDYMDNDALLALVGRHQA